MSKERIDEVMDIILKEIDRSFGKNLWDPLTPEEMHNIGVKYKEGIDSYLRSLGYDELKLSSYTVICDERNNSPEDIENGVVNVTIIPTIDRITVEFLLNKEDEENELE
jgi:hypothetical protein